MKRKSLLTDLARAADSCLGAPTSMARRQSVPRRLASILHPSRPISARFGRTTATALGAGAIVVGLGLAAFGAARTKPMPVFQSGVASAKWANGASVKVLCIADGRSSELPAWLPDGSPVSLATITKRQTHYSAGPAAPGKRLVTVVFETKGVMSATPNSIVWRVPKVGVQLAGLSRFHGGGGGGEILKGDFTLHRMYSIPESLMNADLKVGIGTGEYKPILAWPDNSDRFQVFIKPSIHSSNMVSTDSNGQRTETKTKSVAAEMECKMPWAVMDKDWRMVIIRSNGQRLEMNSPDMPGEWSSGADFNTSADLPAEDIAKVVIEARDYEWVTFRNLPMMGRSAPNP